MRLLALTVVALAVASAAGCGGDDFGEPVPPKSTVVMMDGAYRPAHLRVPVGARVTWFNRAEALNTAETDGVGFFEQNREKLDQANLFDIHTVQRGEAESVLFDTPGVYRYHSSLNAKMRGVVEVLGREHRVAITAAGYRPAHLRVEAGDRVTFVNRSEGPESATDNPTGAIDPSPGKGGTDHSGADVNHASRLGFATHALFPGEPQTVVFDVVRDYSYRSAFSDRLEGTIEVVARDGG